MMHGEEPGLRARDLLFIMWEGIQKVASRNSRATLAQPLGGQFGPTAVQWVRSRLQQQCSGFSLRRAGQSKEMADIP